MRYVSLVFFTVMCYNIHGDWVLSLEIVVVTLFQLTQSLFSIPFGITSIVTLQIISIDNENAVDDTT